MAASRWFSLLWRDYTTVLVLALLCAVLSVLTLDEQHPSGAAGGRQLVSLIESKAPPEASVLIVVRDTAEDAAFAAALEEGLSAADYNVIETVRGQPIDARRAINRAGAEGQWIDVIAANHATATWGVFGDLPAIGEHVADARVFSPPSYRRPTFLKPDNLLNIANQIVIIAIIAIGMTMVIIAGGIDLSVGSLVALSAVVGAYLIREFAGGRAAGPAPLALCLAATMVAASLAGAVNGLFVTLLRIPPFIVTLATMSVASGLAFVVSKGESISEVPPSIHELMQGTPLGIQNGVIVMLILYLTGHFVLSRTTLGRYLYAVGGNRKAAWLCGLPVARVEIASYAISGALAGLAGILMVSQYRSASPTYGQNYELQTIAAVVVGGTSLSGGQGRMFGTLLGALLIAVVQNGMNLTDVSADPQKVVLGLVILAAAILDRLKQGRTTE